MRPKFSGNLTVIVKPQASRDEFKRSETKAKLSIGKVVSDMKTTPMHKTLFSRLAGSLSLFLCVWAAPAFAQAPATQDGGVQTAQDTRGDEYLPPWQRGQGGGDSGAEPSAPQRITPPRAREPAPPPSAYEDDSSYGGTTAAANEDLPPPRDYTEPPSQSYAPPPPYEDETYSSNEIIGAGHRFFGGVSKGLAKVVEHAFARQGRPNGYILGEEAGGAFVAGLRYGEGTLYTKNAGVHRVYWQGPSFGYDFGAEGSKTMILVYNLNHVDQIYNRFAGVDGSAYLVGGVGITFQSHDDIVLAPIRSGVGLRLGANVGYLKYTRTPTWNPF